MKRGSLEHKLYYSDNVYSPRQKWSKEGLKRAGELFGESPNLRGSDDDGEVLSDYEIEMSQLPSSLRKLSESPVKGDKGDE